MELCLVIAEATGRRLGSIRQLRWEDIDLERRLIKWRAEADKKEKEWVVPMPIELADELKQFRKRLGAISGWIFFGERLHDQCSVSTRFRETVVETEPFLYSTKHHQHKRQWCFALSIGTAGFEPATP